MTRSSLFEMNARQTYEARTPQSFQENREEKVLSLEVLKQ